MDARPSSSPLRIVIFPWPAFGHLLPYLELAERLAWRGHRVSYVSTSRNLARLPPLHPATALRVDLVALPLPRVQGLPDGAESSYDLPDEKREFHFQTFDSLAAPFAEFLAAACADEATRPHWIVFDAFHHLAAAVALEHKVPSVVNMSSAAMLATMPHTPPENPEADPAVAAVFEQAAAAARAVPRYEREGMAPFVTGHGASCGISRAQRCLLTQERCTLMATRSCVEWEPESFPLAATLLGKPVVPLGLLPPSPDGGRRSAGNNGSESEHATVRWLDAQPLGSVLYVAMVLEIYLIGFLCSAVARRRFLVLPIIDRIESPIAVVLLRLYSDNGIDCTGHQPHGTAARAAHGAPLRALQQLFLRGLHRLSVFVAIDRDFIDNAAIDFDLRVVHAMAHMVPPSV
ncbi:hypothetical protein QYE76_016502 [Lolium multiflorum]|uniref:Uncharacterized protein n=1 Tax=Lolium multiflorum TaxID=4521 RepID=A0AAD8QK02_LOLMU|nr:hypothetical protein QYE76_016502 [Lolium multiflorum]